MEEDFIPTQDEDAARKLDLFGVGGKLHVDGIGEDEPRIVDTLASGNEVADLKTSGIDPFSGDESDWGKTLGVASNLVIAKNNPTKQEYPGTYDPENPAGPQGSRVRQGVEPPVARAKAAQQPAAAAPTQKNIFADTSDRLQGLMDHFAPAYQRIEDERIAALAISPIDSDGAQIQRTSLANLAHIESNLKAKQALFAKKLGGAAYLKLEDEDRAVVNALLDKGAQPQDAFKLAGQHQSIDGTLRTAFRSMSGTGEDIDKARTAELNKLLADGTIKESQYGTFRYGKGVDEQQLLNRFGLKAHGIAGGANGGTGTGSGTGESKPSKAQEQLGGDVTVKATQVAALTSQLKSLKEDHLDHTPQYKEWEQARLDLLNSTGYRSNEKRASDNAAQENQELTGLSNNFVPKEKRTALEKGGRVPILNVDDGWLSDSHNYTDGKSSRYLMLNDKSNKISTVVDFNEDGGSPLDTHGLSKLLSMPGVKVDLTSEAPIQLAALGKVAGVVNPNKGVMAEDKEYRESVSAELFKDPGLIQRLNNYNRAIVRAVKSQTVNREVVGKTKASEDFMAKRLDW